MELLKKLEEAKSHGLSKEEFFQLLDFEVKLTENKCQGASLLTGGTGSGKGSEELVKLLEKVCHQLEQQTLRKQCREIFEKYQQSQQEFHNKICQDLNKLTDRIVQQHQQLQQDLLQGSQLNQDNGNGDQQKAKSLENYGKCGDKLEQNLQLLKNDVQEVRNIVLNKLEDENSKLKCEISQAQVEIQNAMSRIEEGVKANKQALKELEVAVKKNEEQAVLNNAKKSIEVTEQSMTESSSFSKDETAQGLQDAMRTFSKHSSFCTSAEKENRLIGYKPPISQTFTFEIDDYWEKAKTAYNWYSPPWHLEQIGSGVAGLVRCDGTGEIEVSVVKACDPSKMGFQPKVQFNSTVWLIDPEHYNSDLIIGSGTYDFDGTGWEIYVGTIDKEQLRSFRSNDTLHVLFVFDNWESTVL